MVYETRQTKKVNELNNVPPDLRCVENAEWIIQNFKIHYLNKKGLISRTYPVSDRTIFDNFDDLAPFFLYYGEIDFLLEQITRLGPDPFETLLPVHNIIYSYMIDEYLGGMYCLFRKTHSPIVKRLLDDAVGKCLKYFVVDGVLVEFYDLTARKASPYYSPWSSGLLETFLEMLDVCPHLMDLVIRVVHRWLDNRFYLQEALFPFRSSHRPLYYLLGQLNARRKVYREHCPTLPRGEQLSLLKQINYHARKCFYLYASSGHFVQLMKSNTTMIFTLIEMYRLTGENFYREHITRWMNSCLSKLVSDGTVYGRYYPTVSVDSPSLANAFILIDVLSDTYWFVDRDMKYLNWAMFIAERQLATQWANGLLPMHEGSDRDHLDHQVDFAVSLRRIGELAGNAGYLQRARRLIENTLRFHRVEHGFCTHVDTMGKPVYMPVNMVDPKYNALLLKGLILLSEERSSIYEKEALRDLLKDR